MFFSGRNWETSQDRGKDKWSKMLRDPWWKPAPEHSGPQTGVKGHLATGQQPEAHSQDNAGVALGQVSEWSWVAEPEAGLDPIGHLWREIKIAVQRCSPSNLQSLRGSAEKDGRNYRWAKLVASYPRRLKTVIAAKHASTKYWVKGLNTYGFFLYICKNVLKPAFASSLWGIVCRLIRGKKLLHSFSIGLLRNKMWKKSRGLKTFRMHCIVYLSQGTTTHI